MKWTLKFLGGSAQVSREAAEFAVNLDTLLRSPACRPRVRAIADFIKNGAATLEKLEKSVGVDNADAMMEKLLPPL